MTFVDSSIWYAANVPEDPDHDEARRLLLEATSPLALDQHFKQFGFAVVKP